MSGMNAAVLASGIDPGTHISTLEEECLGSIKSAGGAVKIAALDDERQEEAVQAIVARKIESQPLKAYGRTCGAPGQKGPAGRRGKAGDERAPLAKFLHRFFPVATWFPQLTLQVVKADLIAGLTVGVMVIPQSMSYAAIAGLAYKYGMYSACWPTLVYAFCGQSRQLAVGPVAMVSLLVEAGLRGLLTEAECPEWYAQGGEASALSQADLCPTEYAQLASLTALTVGVMQVVGSVLKLGFLVSFLGHPVTSGFTSGAAIIIGLSQLKYVLGFDVPKSQFVHETAANILGKLFAETNGVTVVLGLAWFCYLTLNKWAAGRLKQLAGQRSRQGDEAGARRFERLSVVGALGPLISCALGILLLWSWPQLREDFHVKYIGEIPQGFAAPSFAFVEPRHLAAVLPTALSACLIGYMESIAIGKNLAAKHSYEIDAGQEMLALGLSNFVGAFFSCYPVTGSFSRSAVANSTGAQSQLAGLVTAVMMFVTLMLLTPLFYYLPKYVLAVIVMSSVLALVAFEEAKKLWRIKRHDFVLWVVAFAGTLFLGVLMGIVVAVSLSLVIVIYESVRPQITILWRIPGTSPQIYRSMKQESNGLFVPNVFICRIGSSMYFANAHYVKDMLLSYVGDLEEANPTEYIVLEMTPVTSVDSTACSIIKDIVNDFRGRGIETAFAMVGNRVEKTLRKADLKSYVGEEWFFPTVNDAVLFCLKHQHAKVKRLAGTEGRGGVREALDISDIDIHADDEVGFTNELEGGEDGCTAAFISLGQDIPMSEITAVFKRNKIDVVRCQVEPLGEGGARHTYQLRSRRSNGQLSDFEMARAREELSAVFGRYSRSDVLSRQSSPLGEAAGGMFKSRRDLEQALAAQQESNAKMSVLMQIQNERIDRLMSAVEGRHGCGVAGGTAGGKCLTCTVS